MCVGVCLCVFACMHAGLFTLIVVAATAEDSTMLRQALIQHPVSCMQQQVGGTCVSAYMCVCLHVCALYVCCLLLLAIQLSAKPH